MAIPFPLYARVKDNYCIAYFGNCTEYLVQLRLLRPIMEETFKGITVYIAHKESASHIFQGCENTLTKEELEPNRNDFAYIRELTCDMHSHPVENFMLESDIPFKLSLPPKPNSERCVLITKSTLPTKNLTPEQIVAAKLHANREVDIDGPIQDAGWVIGVESEQLYEAAAKGCKVTLIPTGIGENLFKRMFTGAAILRI